MIAVDTNMLLRILLADHPKQSRRAQALLDKAGRVGEPVFVPDIVLCEVEWVLTSVFDLPRKRVAETLRRLLAGEEFHVANRTAARGAVASYERGKAEFSDHLIGATATAAGATTTFTFDRGLQNNPDFTLLR